MLTGRCNVMKGSQMQFGIFSVSDVTRNPVTGFWAPRWCPSCARRWSPVVPPGVPDAPTHASLVKVKYGDAEPRQPGPNPNRGDNVTGTSPYQDSDPDIAVRLPLIG